MSTDFHRPTLTFPNNAYNATQVRLYGKVADMQIVPPRGRAEFGNTVITYDDFGELDEDQNAAANKLNEFIAINRKERKPSKEINQAIIGNNLGLPPLIIPVGYAFHLAVDLKTIGTAVAVSSFATGLLALGQEMSNQKVLSSGIVTGYSFEGHCYDLAKPKLMLIPVLPVHIPADDCGYDAKNRLTPGNEQDNDYRVWIIDKLDECVEFDINQGFAEQLVLEANLPGNRSPTMYAGRARLGHRSGRLND